MSSLFGKSVASTYKDLLQISNNNIGVDDTIRYIEDGEGTPSALGISSNMIGISGHVIPQDNELYDLGDAEHKFRHLYLSDSTIYIGDTTFNVADIEALKEIQTAATIPLSTVIENAESALQSSEVSLLDLTNEFQTEYGALKDTAASAVQPNTSPVFEDVQVTGNINGPAIMRIDPAAVGDNTGRVIIAGDLQVDGDTTTVNSTTIATSSLTIELAQGATDATQADGAGVHVNGADATLKYSSTTDTWTSNKSLDVPSIKQLNVDQTSTFNSDVNIGTAFQLKGDGTIGGVTPNTVGQAIVWDGAKYRPGSAVPAGGGDTDQEVPQPFVAGLQIGESVHTINFQKAGGYTNVPAIVTDLQISADVSDSPIIPYVITNVTNSNFTVEFAEALPSSAYSLHVTFGGRDILWQDDDSGLPGTIKYDLGDVNVTNSLTVGGNLTVQGNSSIINTNELNIKDHNIIIASGTASQDLSGAVLGDAGITWGDDDTVKLGYDSRHGFAFQGGNVGVGITDPRSKLDVAGSIRVGSTGSYDKLLIESEEKFGVYEGVISFIPWTVPGSGTSEYLTHFKTRVNGDATGSTRHDVVIDGNLGVGTASPGAKLHIKASSLGQEGLIVENSLGNQTAHIGHLTDGTAYFKLADQTGENHALLRDNGHSFLNALDGNVGIGTSDPTGGKLHIIGGNSYGEGITLGGRKDDGT